MAGKRSGTTTPFAAQFVGAVPTPEVRSLDTTSTNAANERQMLELGGLPPPKSSESHTPWFAIADSREVEVGIRNGSSTQVLAIGTPSLSSRSSPSGTRYRAIPLVAPMSTSKPRCIILFRCHRAMLRSMWMVNSLEKTQSHPSFRLTIHSGLVWVSTPCYTQHAR